MIIKERPVRKTGWVFLFEKQVKEEGPNKAEDRHAQLKIPVACLVTEDIHAAQASESTSQGCEKKQLFFRNPIKPLSGFAFV